MVDGDVVSDNGRTADGSVAGLIKCCTTVMVGNLIMKWSAIFCDL